MDNFASKINFQINKYDRQHLKLCLLHDRQILLFSTDPMNRYKEKNKIKIKIKPNI